MSILFGFPVASAGRGIVSMFPQSWRTDVTVIRGGGRDPKGNPLPAYEIPVPDCVVGPRFTEDPVDRSDVTEDTSALYRNPGFTFLSTDRVRVPDGALMAGEWMVDGRPGEWPLGVHVQLKAGP